ncbi:ABC transporter ATP-binding protein [Halanaerobium saccharolyticum]|uniref:ABC transporter ATP-binding protein n=1 Tax=Halanaerobium saccharolyticum TaxID=43595 RepID=UPI001FBA2870|nr:ABC transporter ATP-binding protein [Halanaerobium saccharolyticum]
MHFILLKTKDLNVGYDDTLVVKGLNIEISEHKITAIIGANGSGKSTLLKALTRIIPYNSGEIILDGQNINSTDTRELAKKISILPQTQEMATGMTVGELVSYGRFPYQSGLGRLTKKDYEVINWALEVTGTDEFKYRSVDALSGGQRQRVWIAMALAQETDTIFLDEPTTYLDLAHQLEVLKLLDDLNKRQGRTIIMVLHDLNQAARFADYIIAMKDGKVVKAGDPEEVISASVLKEIFNIDALIGRDPITDKPMCVTYNIINGGDKDEKNYNNYADTASGF